MSFSEPTGQGWPQIAALALAFVLSASIGLEREIRNKNAGLRTYTLIGFTAALIMLVSKYGFSDVLVKGTVRVDPSRVAAQVIVGIGFIGGGLIFVKGEAVRGLTTAASVWLTAAVGMACGAGLPWLAIAVTCGQFIVAFGFPPIERRLPGSNAKTSEVKISYRDDDGRLRVILGVCDAFSFAVRSMKLERWSNERQQPDDVAIISLALKLEGESAILDLVKTLDAQAGIVAIEVASISS